MDPALECGEVQSAVAVDDELAVIFGLELWWSLTFRFAVKTCL
ncbi:hypothetical protein [Pseudonocardia sp. GCM10023141]